MRFELRTRPGDANIKSVAVTLPKAFAIDQRHLGNICSKSQLESELCAGRQPIGTVMTKTPLLDAPLSGPAYAVSGFGKLPRVAFILDGQVRVIPQAESASVKGGHLRTVVPVVPDVPIGYFRLDLFGGKHGYLVNTRDLCASAGDDRRRLRRPERQGPLADGQDQDRLRQAPGEAQAPPALELVGLWYGDVRKVKPGRGARLWRHRPQNRRGYAAGTNFGFAGSTGCSFRRPQPGSAR